jgi:hypothetical protein
MTAIVNLSPPEFGPEVELVVAPWVPEVVLLLLQPAMVSNETLHDSRNNLLNMMELLNAGDKHNNTTLEPPLVLPFTPCKVL